MLSVTARLGNCALAISRLSYLAFLILPALAIASFAQDSTWEGIVAAEKLQVHDDSSQASKVVGLIKEGDHIVVLDTSADRNWLQVRTTSGTVGWVGYGCIEHLADDDEGVDAWVVFPVLLVGSTLVLSLLWHRRRALRPETTSQEPKISRPSKIVFAAGMVLIYGGATAPALSLPGTKPRTFMTTSGPWWYQVAVIGLWIACLYALFAGIPDNARALRHGGCIALLMSLIVFGECYSKVQSFRANPLLIRQVINCVPAAAFAFHLAKLGWGSILAIAGAFLITASGLIGGAR